MAAAILFVILFLVLGLPVVLGIGSSMFKRWLTHKENMADVLAAHTAEQAAQYAARTERLEQRVRVLERIVTDRGATLAASIEDLRGGPPHLN